MLNINKQTISVWTWVTSKIVDYKMPSRNIKKCTTVKFTITILIVYIF